MNGIWIRTQDRNRILFCDCFRIEKNVNKKYNIIGGELGVETAVELGTYKTKEKALKVLDDIQEHINDSDNYNLGNLKDPNYHTITKDLINPVFQMPTDEEVK